MSMKCFLFTNKYLELFTFFLNFILKLSTILNSWKISYIFQYIPCVQHIDYTISMQPYLIYHMSNHSLLNHPPIHPIIFLHLKSNLQILLHFLLNTLAFLSLASFQYLFIFLLCKMYIQ